MKRTAGLIAAVAYVLTIAGANWAVKHVGVVPVWWGYTAPAAVYFVSAALILRDGVQRWLGVPAALATMAAGLGISVATGSAKIALGSALGFAASELADLGGFTFLSSKGRWLEGVALGASVGIVLDSVIFLTVAPQIVPGLDNMSLLPGQLIGKSIAVGAALVILLPPRIQQARTTAAAVAA